MASSNLSTFVPQISPNHRRQNYLEVSTTWEKQEGDIEQIIQASFIDCAIRSENKILYVDFNLQAIFCMFFNYNLQFVMIQSSGMDH